MRERQSKQRPERVHARITPAYAGKTAFFIAKIYIMWDHPRVCGKDLLMPMLTPLTVGSPPRMRERHLSTSKSSTATGITPAYAGKTSVRNYRRDGTQDHPRVCGKDKVEPVKSLPAPGSPPRMRERRDDRRVIPRNDRITPAYAGKTKPMAGVVVHS